MLLRSQKFADVCGFSIALQPLRLYAACSCKKWWAHFQSAGVAWQLKCFLAWFAVLCCALVRVEFFRGPDARVDIASSDGFSCRIASEAAEHTERCAPFRKIAGRWPWAYSACCLGSLIHGEDPQEGILPAAFAWLVQSMQIKLQTQFKFEHMSKQDRMWRAS